MIIFVFLGLVACVFQLVILREFTFSIAKNELGLVLAAGAWLIACSFGSIFRARQKPTALPPALLLFLAFSFSASAIHLAKSFAGLRYYEAASLGFAAGSSVLLVCPTAFTVGYLFAHFIRDNLGRRTVQDDKIYAKFFGFEALGFFLGGIIFTFLFSSYSNPFIFTPFVLPLLAAEKRVSKKLLPGLLIAVSGLVLFLNFNNMLSREFGGAKIMKNTGSPYGPVVSAAKTGIKTYFASGSLLATSEDKQGNEEFIHMSLSALAPEKEKNILFIGACLSGQIEEILKHKVKLVDCLQINPELSLLAKDNLVTGIKANITFISDDPRLYLRQTAKRYDAILMHMPPPSSFALNRYYTQEFFALISRRLDPDGIFAFQIPSKREILSPQFIRFNSSIINAVDNIFRARFLIPSDSMLVISGNSSPIRDSCLLDNFAKEKINTSFLTYYHFRDYLDRGFRDYTEGSLDKRIEANTDANPSGLLNYLALEQKGFYPRLDINVGRSRIFITAIILAAFALILIFSAASKRISLILNIWTVGFSSIGLSSLIFILFQLYSGALFWKLGILVALFMAGLSIGTWILNSLAETLTFRKSFMPWLYLGWVFLYFSLSVTLNKVSASNYLDNIFYFYAFLGGILTGGAYPLLTRQLSAHKFRAEEIATFIYAADLSGSFIGTIALSVLFIPLMGINYSLIILICINALLALKNLLF